jgi:dephospho-CoA kinase
MAKIILGLVGPIASGKGTVCNYLKNKYNAEIFRFSTILRDLLDRIYLPQSRENMQKLSSILRQNFGEDLLAQAMVKDFQKSPSEIIILDGVRREADIKEIKSNTAFYLIEISADIKTRYERIIKRSENTDDSIKTFEQFQSDEQQETETQIQKLAQAAALHIDNSGSIDELYRQIDEILNKLK